MCAYTTRLLVKVRIAFFYPLCLNSSCTYTQRGGTLCALRHENHVSSPQMDSSFMAVDVGSQSNVRSSDVRSWPGSSAASLAPPESDPPPESDLSGMAQALADALSPSELQQDDALAFDHVESFNILCVGESGLGKSTFLRDIFAHLDPTKQQEMIDSL